jgi:hypothetical protein
MQLRIIVGALAIFLCGSAEQAGTQPAEVNRQMTDEAVIETVLVDVLTSSDEVSKATLRGQGGEQLIFDNQCERRAFPNPNGIRRTREKWESAKLADSAAVREAADNLLDRIQRINECYTPFKPQDKRISIWKEHPASTQPRTPMSVRPIRVFPPGYADGNRLALVILLFPTEWKGTHGGRATYLLSLDGKNWTVIARDIFRIV